MEQIIKRLTFALILLLAGSIFAPSFGQTSPKAETALAQYLEGNIAQAKQTANEAINADKNDALAYAVRGCSEQFDYNFAAAQADLEKAIRLSPGNGACQSLLADCYRLNNNTIALSKTTANKAISLLPSPKTAFEYYARALAYYTVEKDKEAMADFTKSIELNPRNVRALSKRGSMFYSAKQDDLAIADFTKSININPRYSIPYYSRGNAYLNQQKLEQAIADYTKAVEFDPKFADAWFNRAVAYKRMQKYEQALADYSKVITLTPKDFDAYNNRGHVYFMQQQYDLAMTDYNKAIELNPGLANSYVFRGNTYTRKQQPELALKDLNKAIELNSKYADAWMERGHVYYNKKVYDEALLNYNKVIELAPQNANGYLYAGFVHHDKQHFNQAINHYNKAIELDDKNMYAYVNRADAYEAIGNSKQAIVDRKKYADLGGKIAATGSNTMKSLFPSGTFDPALAKSGLARGLSTIRGRACSKFDGLRFDAAGVKVVLFPVTPYLEEWYEMRDKKEDKKTSVYMSNEANQYRIETTADNEGRFAFEGLKPGKYFIQIIHSFNQLKTARVYTGQDTRQNGPVREITNYYYDQDYTVGRSKRLEKFVEIKEDGETKKITLANGLIKSCAF
ncbi:MAG: tetratricopeptide repeat protein [Niastella sp.]|nr:tetratricopeptide repeat protein [Niastella sp.]